MALRDINMIPPEVVARRFRVRHLSFWFWVLGGLLALTVIFYIYHMNRVQAERSALVKGSVMNARLVTTIEEIKQGRDHIQSLKQEFAALENMTRRHFYYQVIERLSDLFRGGAWLERLEIHQERKGRIALELTGFSASNQKLAGLLKALSDSPRFGEVLLEKTEVLPAGDSPWPAPVVGFTMTCSFTGGGE